MTADGLLSGPARRVGVDVGTKRVGLAVSDPLQLFAQPHGTYSPENALDELARLAESDGIDGIVVGWPLTEDGGEDEATDMVRAFVERIEETLADPTIARSDERYTSERAKELLRRVGVSQPGRYDKGRVDAAAAAVILQDYLDAADS